MSLRFVNGPMLTDVAADLLVSGLAYVPPDRGEPTRHLAHHDPVTGQPNRRLFGERLDKALAARGALPRPRPVQGGQRQLRPQRGR